MEDRVSATPAALKLIQEVIADRNQLCLISRRLLRRPIAHVLPQNDFIVGDRDVLLGHIGGAPVYISASQFEAWKHTELIIDVVFGRGRHVLARQWAGSAVFDALDGMRRLVRHLTRRQDLFPGWIPFWGAVAER